MILRRSFLSAAVGSATRPGGVNLTVSDCDLETRSTTSVLNCKRDWEAGPRIRWPLDSKSIRRFPDPDVNDPVARIKAPESRDVSAKWKPIVPEMNLYGTYPDGFYGFEGVLPHESTVRVMASNLPTAFFDERTDFVRGSSHGSATEKGSPNIGFRPQAGMRENPTAECKCGENENCESS